MTHRQASIETMAAVIQLLTKTPRSVPEVSELTGTSKNAVMRYFKALSDEGLIERAPEHDQPTGGIKRQAWRWVQ